MKAIKALSTASALSLFTSSFAIADVNSIYLQMQQKFREAAAIGTEQIPLGAPLICLVQSKTTTEESIPQAGYLNFSNFGGIILNTGSCPARHFSQVNIEDASAPSTTTFSGNASGVDYSLRIGATGDLLMETTEAQPQPDADPAISNPSRFVQSYALCPPVQVAPRTVPDPMPQAPSQPEAAAQVIAPVPVVVPAPAVRPAPVEPVVPPPQRRARYSCNVKCGGFVDRIQTRFSEWGYTSTRDNMSDAFDAALLRCREDRSQRGRQYHGGIIIFSELTRDHRGRIIAYEGARMDQQSCFCSENCN